MTREQEARVGVRRWLVLELEDGISGFTNFELFSAPNIDPGSTTSYLVGFVLAFVLAFALPLAVSPVDFLSSKYRFPGFTE